MLVNKSFKLFLDRALVTLLLLFIFCCPSGCLSKTSNSTLSTLSMDGGNSTPNLPRIIIQEEPKKVAVVFLPGLGMSQCQFTFIENKLTDCFKDKIIIIKPTYREEKWGGFSSTLLPLNHSWVPDRLNFLKGYGVPTQLNGVSKEIKKELKQQGIEIGKDYVIVIGISQGGPLAVMVAKELNLTGIVTINAPLKGISSLSETKIKDLNKFLSNCKAPLESTAIDGKGIKTVKGCAKLLFWVLLSMPGVSSMRPDSSCTKEVIKFINKFINKASIPSLLIGSYTKNIFSNVEKIKEDAAENDIKYLYEPLDYQSLEEAFAKLITGKESGYHDGLIATSSQLFMEDDQLTNLLRNIRQQDKSHSNLYRVYIEGLTHAEVIVPINSDASIKIDTKELPVVETDERVANHIIDFIDQIIINTPPKKFEDA